MQSYRTHEMDAISILAHFHNIQIQSSKTYMYSKLNEL